VSGHWHAEKQKAGLQPAIARALMVGLLLLSAALLWHDLGTREVLGRDEPLTIINVDQPDLKGVLAAISVRFTGQPSNTQPLYFVLQHLSWPLVQRSAFLLRFLPSAFALLTVAMTYKLGEALFGREAGLLGALFTALLPLHVQYAQIARPYTLLALLSLASAYFLVRGLQTNRPLHWAGFVLAATLNFYNHYNALLVLATEGLFTAIIWLAMSVQVARGRRSAAWLVGPVVAFLLVGILCLPGLIRLARLPWVGLEGGAEPSGEVAVQLTVPFFGRLLTRVGLTTAWLRGLILGLIALGLASSLYRRRWQTALFAILWLAIPFVILSAMRSPRPFEERYVIFVPPVALLLAGQGVVALGQILGGLGQRWSPRVIQGAAIGIISAALVLLFVGPLRAQFRAEQSAERMEHTLTVVEHQARPGDVVVISPRTFVRPLSTDGAEVLYLTEHLSPAALDELVQPYQRVWVLYTGFQPIVELQEPLDPWVQARHDQFLLMPIKAPTAIAYANLATTDAEANLKDRIAVLQELVQGPAGAYGRWVRYGILADAYQALGDLYASQGESSLAAEYWSKAEETRAAAPPPW
jgi:4-amino-4-deoxy-L-arabinose transferase-like glycosyltransferase